MQRLRILQHTFPLHRQYWREFASCKFPCLNHIISFFPDEKLMQDRYDEFMRIVRQWRNLKQLKRGGRGHEDSGIDGTKPGELALLCPACPHPGINLPPDWELAPLAKLYGVQLLLTSSTDPQ